LIKGTTMKTIPYTLIICLWTALTFISAHAQPWTPQVIWQRNGAGDSSRYGSNIYPLGDQNGDGYEDFAVEGWGWGAPGQASEIKTEFFHGGNPPSTTPYRVFRGDSATGKRYFGIVPLGDINGDHVPDWGVMMDSVVYQRYVLRVYYGSADPNSAPVYTFALPSYNVNIWGMGDFNGDGYGDMYRYDWDQDFGQVLFGGAVIDTIPHWTRHSPPGFGQQALPTSFGDINGDGYSDFISVSSSNPQRWMHVFLGGSIPDTIPHQSISGGNYGVDTRIVNDLNGDGRADIASGLEIRWGGNTISAQPNVMLTSPCQWPGGGSNGGIGDINHDGWGDYVLSEEYCSNDYFGAAMLYLGSPWMTSAPAYTFWGYSEPADIIGHQVAAGLGDVNGDGVDDFALGGFNDTNIGYRGRAVIFAGDSNLRVGVGDFPPALPKDFSVAAYPNPFNSTTTIQLAIPSGVRTIDLKLYDVLGREAWSQTVPALASEMRISLTADGLASGVYILTATSAHLHQSHKLVLLK
jgi:hypothetical protein